MLAMLAMLFIATFFDTLADSREWGVENHGDHSDHSEAAAETGGANRNR
jgi:hypothetical protein